MITTVFAFVLTLGVLIVIHEYGHYRVAVACGVRVLRFSVGFGRVLWRRQATPDSTEFVVCALPLGGYVKMLDEREGPVSPDQLDRSFNRKRLWQRAAIVAAGPAANLLLAVVLYAAAHWIGIDEPKAVLGPPPAASLAERAGLRAGDWAQAYSTDGVEWLDLHSMTDLRWQITQAVLHGDKLQLMVTDQAGRGQRRVTLDLDSLGSAEVDAKLMQRIGVGNPFSEPVLGKVTPDSAGARAGLRVGDRVLRIDGVEIVDSAKVRELIRASVSGGVARAMQWHLERDGRSLDLQVTASVVTEAGKQVGLVGVLPGQPPEMVTVRYGALDGLGQAVRQTWQMSALTVKMLGKMLIGQASLKNLSGPLTIAEFAGDSATAGAGAFAGFLVLISLSLGFLNLLPIPILDGGQIVYQLLEWAKGSPLSERVQALGQQVGVALLVLLMGVALFNDIARQFG
jgi:regulator of sigma E protease